MTPPPENSTPPATGPPDRQTLRLLERHLASDSLVTETKFDPDAYEPRSVLAMFDTEQYPNSVLGVRLDVRWFTSGDFSFHYIETHADERHWECRWDRHPNTHNSRTHFHIPPSGTDVTDIELSSHPLEVYSTVLEAVEKRLETTW